jgi:alternate signal-mediated exported protein
VAVLAVLAALGGGLATLALWSAQATQAGSAMIASGELKVAQGAFEWSETTSDVPAANRQGSAKGGNLADFHAMPGDSLELRQPFQISARGKNLVFDVTVAWASDPATPAPLAATYQIIDQSNNVLAGGDAPLAVGQSATLTSLPAGDATLSVVVAVVYPAASAPLYQPSPGVATAEPAAVPAIEVTAEQVRWSQ